MSTNESITEHLKNLIPKDAVEAPQKPREELKPRITVVTKSYYQPPDNPAVSVVARFSRDVATDKQIYVRNLTATEEWLQVDIGWLETTSMLIIVNREGQQLQTKPTQQEQEAINQKVLQVTYLHPSEKPVGYLLIAPGESLRITPSNLEHLCIRCKQGSVKYTLNAFPG